MPEDYVETKRSWIHKWTKRCPHCNLPIDIEVGIPFTHPVPTLKMKGGVKAKSTIRIELPPDAERTDEK